MSITPRFTNAAKHTLKTSRLVARGRGVPQADHLDILLAALTIGTELHPTMPIPTPRTLWDNLRHPIGFTPHAQSLVRTVATQATADISLINLTKATGDVNPLTSLEATRQLRTELERRETMLVRRARNQGATWEQIAAALGVTKQAVHKKYGGRGLLYREK